MEERPLGKNIVMPPDLSQDEGKLTPEVAENEMTSVQYWSAPLPRPEEFNAYPESTQKSIVDIMEREVQHRHALKDREQTYKDRAQFFTFAIMIFVVAICAYLVVNGNPWGLLGLLTTVQMVLPHVASFLKAIKELFSKQSDENNAD